MKTTRFSPARSPFLFLALCFFSIAEAQPQRSPVVPAAPELQRAFGVSDEKDFLAPPKVYHPETWFHFIGGNVAKDGITKDLEAIAQAGFSGITLFHGQFGGPWPGVEPQISSLSPNWDDAVQFTAKECRRLGLNFSMNNCPGWATSGGPWIQPPNAMRTLVMSRTYLDGGQQHGAILPSPNPDMASWRDYHDIAVLAFPTPDGDSAKPLVPFSVSGDMAADWPRYLKGGPDQPVRLAPTDSSRPHWLEFRFLKPTTLRSVEFSSIQAFNHSQSYEPGVTFIIQAVAQNGVVKDILRAGAPQSNWQDDQPFTLACSETPATSTYRVLIVNRHEMKLSSLRLYSAARKNNWESEAGWTLRSLERAGDHPRQSATAFVDPARIIDLSARMDANGKLDWQAPKGKWTILRFGHVNAGKENGPAPKEATGWEADKLAKSGADAQFAGYVGRLSAANGPLKDGLLTGMSIDSWECHTQSWTPAMERAFAAQSGYALRRWLPSLFGYVLKDQETDGRFLSDWRKTLNHLFSANFYGRMAELARKNGLSVSYETAAGDVLTGDIMEYFKYADVPMCEFWQPTTDNFVGSINFKPVKPTVSAARMYGKPRIGAESFTNISLSWDEHFEMLREVANGNTAEGVTHYVFHTYTHNPQTPFTPPGTSFGAFIGTPFLRGQTWWKYMPAFTDYLSRCTYLLERGKPVSDVLWYLGDETNHKPDQNAAFPSGFKYDYCNPDALLNRIAVKNGLLVTPEGIQYRLLWLPDAPRLMPETLEKIAALIRQGAVVLGEAPKGMATLSGGAVAQRRFDAAVTSIWGRGSTGLRKNGDGFIASGISLQQTLDALKMQPDVSGGDALWLHRKAENADWYFVSAPRGKGFSGRLHFRQQGKAEIWDPVTGTVQAAQSVPDEYGTSVSIGLLKSAAVFVVFRHDTTETAAERPRKATPFTEQTLAGPWTLRFPAGWGISDSLTLATLLPWKDLPVSAEGKAFSGSAVYTTVFRAGDTTALKNVYLDLGSVDMAATVLVNGREAGKRIAPPYRVKLDGFLKPGENILSVEVTGTWFNRLVYDAGQEPAKRKTWTINGPGKDEPLRNSGLLGPVTLGAGN